MKKLILPISLLLIFSSCAEQQERKDDPTVEKKQPEAVVEKQSNSYYAMPSPEQMFTFINDNGIAFNKSLVLDPALADNYNDPVRKAIVFGIYTADLAYTAAYEDVEGSLKLYKTVRELSQELEIEELMSEEMMQDIQANLENPDSLSLIAGESYYKAVQHLEDNGQEGKLALMTIGGWIESVHITLNSMENIDLESKTAQRIAAQKITFDNLYSYLELNNDKLGIQGEIDKLQEIKRVLSSLKEEKSLKSEKKSGGKLVFEKGKKIGLTKEQFSELKSAVQAYRVQAIAQNI